MDPDLALAARLADDLDGTFAALVGGHADRLYTIALRLLGDPRDAEEAAQDAFVRAYRAIASYEPERIRALRLRPWLASIVVRLSRNRRRRAADRRPPTDIEGTIGGPREPRSGATTEPPTAALAADLARRLAAALDALPAPMRAAIVLRHVAGLPVAEVAEALGRPEATVRSDTHRGLERLRAILARTDPELAAQEIAR